MPKFLKKKKRIKLDNRGEKCIFIGYNEESKAYKLYNPLTNKVVVSRDVIFNEEEAWRWNNEDTTRGKQLEMEEQDVDCQNSNHEGSQQNFSTPPHPTSSS